MNLTTVLYIILAAIVALAIAVFQYSYKSKSKTKSIILFTFLRFLGFFSMLLLLINPKIESRQLETIKPKLVVAIDNSSSIKYLKSDIDVSNFVSKIQDNSALNEKFDIDYFSFNESVETLDSLQFSNNRTNISQTLESLNGLYKENATFLLVTDGNQTLGSDYSFYKSNSKIFPIVVGDTIKQEDLRISKLNVNKYAFLGNNFPVEVFANYNGDNVINPVLTVKNGNSAVYRKNISLNDVKNSEQIIFNLPASKVGVTNYRATLSYLDSEQNRINNSKSFTVEFINEQSKIAIISDIVHPDLGMLKRSIETNKQRKVVVLKPNSAINFNEYQLVILYQPTNIFREAFRTINDKKLNTFIITGTKTDWSFLNSVQQDFKKVTINQTEEYLPNLNTNYSVFVIDDLQIDDFSPLQEYFGEAKFAVPHQSIIYQNIGGFKTENPLLATFTKNNRRGAVLFGENSWKWRVLSYAKNKSFTSFDGFINKLVQYLSVKKIFNQLELDYLPLVYQNDIVKISANYFDSNYTLDNRVELLLSLKNNETKEIKQYPLRLNKNTFEVSLSDLKSGNYNFTVKVKGQNIARSGNFSVLDYNIEQQFTFANTDALKSLAANADGRLSHINNYQKIVEELETDESYKSIQKSTKKIVSLVDWKWLLGFIILIFSLEWFIRKYKGLI